MKAHDPFSKFTGKPLKRFAAIRSSNVDKIIVEGEQPIYLCNYTDVYYNERITDQIEFSKGSADRRETEKFALRAADVVITKDSETADDIAVPALVEPSAAGVVCGYHLAMLRPHRSLILGSYLFWCLRARPIKDAFSIRAQGVTRFGLTLDGMGTVLIPSPDLDTQKVIADFLNRENARVDRLIQKKQNLVALLTEKKSAMTASTVTCGLKPNIESATTGLEWLPKAPKHWNVRRIATLFRESFEMGGDDLPVLSVSINWGISDRELGDDDRHRIVNHIEDRNSYKRVRIGDLAYNMMRAWQGAFGVATVDGLVSPAYVVARPIADMQTRYFEHLFRTPMYIEEFRRASKGIADFRQRLYWEHFRQVRVVVPPLDEQQSICQWIDDACKAIDRVIAPINASIERLQEFRSALITAAITGQIDVATWGKRGEMDRRLDQLEDKTSRRKARA